MHSATKQKLNKLLRIHLGYTSHSLTAVMVFCWHCTRDTGRTGTSSTTVKSLLNATPPLQHDHLVNGSTTSGFISGSSLSTTIPSSSSAFSVLLPQINHKSAHHQQPPSHPPAPHQSVQPQQPSYVGLSIISAPAPFVQRIPTDAAPSGSVAQCRSGSGAFRGVHYRYGRTATLRTVTHN